MHRLSALPVILAVTIAGNLVLSSVARADETPAVEGLIQRGIQLRRTGDDEAALAVFLQAESESPSSVRVLLHVVTAAQAAGKWLMADEYMRKVSQDKNDAYYRRHRASIEQVEAAIAQRVGQFQALGAPEGAEIRLNGESVGKLPMEEPKSLETGTYVLEVVSPGFYNLRRPISVTGGVLTREAVELRERKGDAGGPDGVGVSGSAGGVAARPPPEWWQESWLTWTLAGVGVVAAAGSGAAFVIRERQADKWNDNECLPADGSTRAQACGGIRDDIDLAETIGIVSGITAVAFGGAALAHWAGTSGSGSSDSAANNKSSAKRAKVACTPGFMGVMCQGAF